MYTYKTKNGQDSFLPGIGRTTNGKIITNKPIESTALELIEQTDDNPTSVTGTEVTQPNVVTDATPAVDATSNQPTEEIK